MSDEASAAAGWGARGGLAGLLLLMAAVAILMGIITAEALYPDTYTTHDNEISDLGATRPPDSIIRQPSASIFNGTMIGSGLAILLAAALLYGASRRRVLIPLGLLGFGILGVGIFPGNREPWHPLFALMTFTSGGVAAVLVGLSLQGAFRWASVVLGGTTLAALAFGLFGTGTALFEELGDGGVERWIAYPTVMWLAGLGGYLLHTPDPASAPP